jgi:hypothetical protein
MHNLQLLYQAIMPSSASCRGCLLKGKQNYPVDSIIGHALAVMEVAKAALGLFRVQTT